jgi:hypothetical protein
MLDVIRTTHSRNPWRRSTSLRHGAPASAWATAFSTCYRRATGVKNDGEIFRITPRPYILTPAARLAPGVLMRRDAERLDPGLLRRR